jgi:protein O-mannosyl-transferase
MQFFEMSKSISLEQLNDQSDSHFREYILIVCAGLLVFSPSLFNFFNSDDFAWISRGANLSLKDLLHNAESVSYNRFRPLVPVFFAVLYRFFGLSAWGYHFSSIVLHVINALLFYRLVLHFFLNKEIALLSAVIFVTHFAHEETVYWISSNCILCCCFFSLLSLLSFMKWLKSGSCWFYFLSLGLATIALFFREDAMILPLVFLLIIGLRHFKPDRWAIKSFNRISLSRAILCLLPFLLLILIYLYLRGICFPHLQFGELLSLNPINIIRNFTYFILNLTIPVRLIFDVWGYKHSETMNHMVNSIGSVSILVIAGLLVMTFTVMVFWFWIKKRSGVLKLLTVGFFLFLLPSLFTKGYGLRFTYMPLLGFAPLAAYLLLDLIKRSRSKRLMLGKHYILMTIIIILVFNFLILFERQQWWRETGEICQKTIAQAGAVMSSMPEGSRVCFQDLPVRLHGAYIFKNGFVEAMNLCYPSYNHAITMGDSISPCLPDEEVGRDHHGFKYDHGDFFQLF